MKIGTHYRTKLLKINRTFFYRKGKFLTDFWCLRIIQASSTYTNNDLPLRGIQHQNL
jgi:hypothetical protein